MNLRVHHILCAPLFVGKGYSEEFVRNMTDIVNGIKENSMISLQTEPDVICASCPNLIEAQCSLDRNKVVSKDKDLAKKLGLRTSVSQEAKALFQEIDRKMTEEIFEESCHECSWYQQGLCNYQLYKANLKKFI